VTRRLIVFAPNWLGDAVMALPAVADVRRALPDATIHLAARAPIAPLACLVPGVEHTLILSARSADSGVLAAGGYDAALLFPNSFNSAWTAWRAGIANRWGYRGDGRSLLLTRAVPTPVRVHQAEYYQRLTTVLGFPPGPLEPRLDVSSELRAAGCGRLSAAGWDGSQPLVAVAPGAAYGGAKRWPAVKFASTIDALADEDVRSVLIGAAADRAAGDEVLRAAQSRLRPLNLIGATDLPALAGVLVHCSGLVTHDSGAMHFAAALGVNVTAVFGPTNERETRPLGRARASVVHTDVWCRPCMLRECPLTHRCMTRIAVDDVLRETRAGL
jgi:heptosyltransferase-2